MQTILTPRIFYSLAIILFWFPVYESLHQGQITLVLTALLAAAIHRTPFWRGLLVGLVIAIKPTFGLLLPFIGYLYGWHCMIGMLIGLLPAVITLNWFVEYLFLFPTIAQRDYLLPSPAGVIGVVPSAVISCIITAWIVWRVKDKEWAYLLVIGVVSIGTALWVHSYTPVILPVLYGINRFWKDNQQENLPPAAGAAATGTAAAEASKSTATPKATASESAAKV